MKRTFVFLLLAAAAAVRTAAMNATPEAEPSAETNYAEGNDDKKKTPTQQLIYVIDGEIIKNFDGSQLIGKTIQSYTISPDGTKHSIITNKVATEKVDNTALDDHFFVLDGKIYKEAPEGYLRGKGFEIIGYLKPGDPLFAKYLKEAKNVPEIDVNKIRDIYVINTKPKSKK